MNGDADFSSLGGIEGADQRAHVLLADPRHVAQADQRRVDVVHLVADMMETLAPALADPLREAALGLGGLAELILDSPQVEERHAVLRLGKELDAGVRRDVEEARIRIERLGSVSDGEGHVLDSAYVRIV